MKPGFNVSSEKPDTVVLLEDSRFYQLAVSHELKRIVPGLSVVVAGTLEDGIKAIEENRSRLLCALIDLRLPDSEGEATLSKVREYGIPMIVFSSTMKKDQEEKLNAQYVVDFVYKGGAASMGYLSWIVRRLYHNFDHKVLVVDDSKTARLQVRYLLELCRFSVEEAEHGEEAVKMFESGKRYSMVLTDFNMPGMNGLALTSALRGKFDRGSMAILGISSSDNNKLSAEFLKNGASDFLHKPFIREEFYCRVWQNVDTLENTRALEHAAFRDFLTGMFNRRYFMDMAHKLLATANRNQQQTVVAMVDADHFKSVNDTYGHDVGDDVLRELADRLSAAFPRETDLIARMGGEEFAIFLANTSPEMGDALLNKARELVCGTPLSTRAGPIKVTVSIGAMTGSILSIEKALEEADMRLYDAKESGRNRVVCGEFLSLE